MENIEGAQDLFGSWERRLDDYLGMVEEARELHTIGMGQVDEITVAFHILTELLDKHCDVMDQHRTAMDDGKDILDGVRRSVQTAGLSDSENSHNLATFLDGADFYHAEVNAPGNFNAANTIRGSFAGLEGMINVLKANEDKVEDNCVQTLTHAEAAKQITKNLRGNL